MTNLTTEIATKMVDRIEALNDQISAIYREANEYDGNGNANVIRDIWKARQARREAEFTERGMLESFDLPDDK